MQIAYFDCFHGAAGDMLLASLLDAGLALADLETLLAALPLAGYRLHHHRTTSHGVSGSQVQVHTDAPQPARTWAAIRTLLEQSSLPPPVRSQATAVFARLAHAEAQVHGVPVDDVHFHEVGAVDSIVDVVGVCAALHLLAVEQVYASPLPTGFGWVQTQHGMLPVPAPATLLVLAEVGAPLVPAPSSGELVTPTAAALLAELAHFEQPALHLGRVGYGLGQRAYPRLNGLRVWLGTPASRPTPAPVAHHHPTPGQEQVIELCCNLDDATGEQVAYAIEHLLVAGALDAWSTPLVMKKGRPALQLACLARPGDEERLAGVMLRETTTLGVRWQPMERLAAGRQTIAVATPWGSVRLKQKLLNGVVLASAPEYEDCAALARAHEVPLAEVYAVALQAARAQAGDAAG